MYLNLHPETLVIVLSFLVSITPTELFSQRGHKWTENLLLVFEIRTAVRTFSRLRHEEKLLQSCLEVSFLHTIHSLFCILLLIKRFPVATSMATSGMRVLCAISCNRAIRRKKLDTNVKRRSQFYCSPISFFFIVQTLSIKRNFRSINRELNKLSKYVFSFQLFKATEQSLRYNVVPSHYNNPEDIPFLI